jgi:hypothetical protein
VSADEDVVAIAKVVELSLSESQPFNRYIYMYMYMHTTKKSNNIIHL